MSRWWFSTSLFFFFLFQIYILSLSGWVELKHKTMDGHGIKTVWYLLWPFSLLVFHRKDLAAFISLRMWMKRLRSISVFLLVGKACWVSSPGWSWDSALPGRCAPEVHLSSKREFLLIADEVWLLVRWVSAGEPWVPAKLVRVWLLEAFWDVRKHSLVNPGSKIHCNLISTVMKDSVTSRLCLEHSGKMLN